MLFVVHSKADISQLIYCTEPTSNKWKTEKGKSIKKRMCSEVLVNSPGNPWSQSWRRKGRLRCEGFAEREGCKRAAAAAGGFAAQLGQQMSLVSWCSDDLSASQCSRALSNAATRPSVPLGKLGTQRLGQ